MRRIFISYRRSSSLPDAAFLNHLLSKVFGRGNVFMDIAGLPPGEDFESYLLAEIERCDDFLLLVGDGTFDRIHDPKDWVHREIKHALEMKVRVIPIFVENAKIPEPHELPEDIQDVHSKNGYKLYRDIFEGSVQAIIAGITKGKDSRQEEVDLEVGKFIRGRDAVINRAITMIEETKKDLIGQGDDLNWIRREGEIGKRFEESYKAMLRRNARVQLISSGNGMRALDTAKILAGYARSLDQVKIWFKKYGQVRVLVSDNRRILLAFNNGEEEYFGLYLENEDLASWLALRQLQLTGVDDAVPYDNKINKIMAYNYSLKQYEYLSNDAYFRRLIEIIANAGSSIRLAGHYASAILRKDDLGVEFRDALRMAIEKNRVSTIRILVAKQDNFAHQMADAYLEFRETLDDTFQTNQSDFFLCPKCFDDYGQVRHVVVDEKHLILGIPQFKSTKVLNLSPQNQSYVGLATANKEMAQWLSRRFDLLWGLATPLKP